MNARRDDAHVQECACTALEMHALHDSSVVETLISAGAAASILAAMDLHLADLKVQRNAVDALQAFVSASSAAATEFIKAGAPTRILAAMERHSGDPGVQTFCCFAVASLINNVPAHTEVFGTAPVQRILNAMFQHIDPCTYVRSPFGHSTNSAFQRRYRGGVQDLRRARLYRGGDAPSSGFAVSGQPGSSNPLLLGCPRW
jgi:hypothetical protein